MTTQLTIPGPLHPDLFDGETPIRVPIGLPLKVYQVAVTYVVHENERQTVMLAARNHQEASRLALTLAESRADENEDDFDVEDCQELDGVEPEQTHIDAWYTSGGGRL